MIKINLAEITNPLWYEECHKYRNRLLVGEYRHWCWEWGGVPIDETCKEWPCGCFPEAA